MDDPELTTERSRRKESCGGLHLRLPLSRCVLLPCSFEPTKKVPSLSGEKGQRGIERTGFLSQRQWLALGTLEP